MDRLPFYYPGKSDYYPVTRFLFCGYPYYNIMLLAGVRKIIALVNGNLPVEEEVDYYFGYLFGEGMGDPEDDEHRLIPGYYNIQVFENYGSGKDGEYCGKNCVRDGLVEAR